MADERLELEKVIPSDEGPLMRPGYPRLGGYPEGAAYGYGYGYGEDDERAYVRRMWQAIKKRKLVIAVIAVIVTSVVTLEVFRTKSIYQASTTIEIGKDNRTLRAGDILLQTDESDDSYYIATAMKTKIRLLQSRPVLEDVVINLKLDQNPKLMDVTSKKSIWEAARTVWSKFKPQGPVTPTVAAETPVAAERAGTASREESARLAPYVDVLAANLSGDPLQDTRMLVISFTHTDPALAADIVDNVAQVFIRRTFENKTEKYTSASDWLDRSTRELKARVEEAEQKLANYSRDHNIYSTDGKETLATGKLSQLHDLATRAETDRMLRQSLYEEVRAGRSAQLPEAFADPKTGDLQRKLGDLKVNYAQLSATYGEKNPKLVEVKQQIVAIEQQVAESRGGLELKLKADYERAVRDEASMKAALDRAKAEASQQNQAFIEYNILKQEVETNKGLYTDFLQKTSQAKIQEHEQHSNMKMIDPPQVPISPIGPNRLRTILIGFFVSLVAGVGLVFFLEYLDNTVKTVEDVSRYAQLPALSVIPSITARRSRLLVGKGAGKKMGRELALNGNGHVSADQLMTLDSRSSVAEAYRVLRTSVLLSSVDNPPKVIMVTSGQPGEGKTTTAINTAISLAQLGSAVLIIDCDLRKPSAHKVLGVELTRGLSTYLSRSVDIDDCIQKLPIANLSLLPCGPIPPNPAEMISSLKMRELLQTLRGRYDHIVIDSPPLLKVTDPVILSTLVDGVILVVHGGKSTRDVVRRTRHELAIAGAKVFGVVLNNVDVQHQEYDGYYGTYSDYGQESGRSESAGAGGD
ncbi:MAG TPA: polysaccharide biosynthesis tyrosine autokinase [Blastocatellia bacterium]|nr:polysaccharide biosynthesis tyrosine autokinase [Blastocatellia bacterium]